VDAHGYTTATAYTTGPEITLEEYDILGYSKGHPKLPKYPTSIHFILEGHPHSVAR